MVVKHNLTAKNSNRMLGVTTKTQAKSTEKLSSGYKINRAADDAAGLAISEKMRKQIRGLTQASENAQDGISTVQTADGALNEVHDMLHRLTELSVKAANGTLSESDRDAVQSEVDQLISEIDRVSTTTKFNETYLLRGSNKGNPGKLTYTDATIALNSAFSTVSPDGVNAATGTMGVPVAKVGPTADEGIAAPLKGTTQYTGKTVGPIGTNPEVKYILVESASAAGTGTVANVGDVIKNINSNPSTSPVYKAFASMSQLTAALKADYSKDIRAVSSFVDPDGTLKLKVESFADLNDSIDVSLHVGTDSALDNKIYMNIEMLSAKGLGLNGLKVSGNTHDAATAAIDVVESALQRVSAQRSALGAIQNRLEHTIANLDNIVENTTAAESQIRDTDMASEMVTYSNNNILAQAGQAMLAQANQSTQGVLSLLQ